MTMLLKMLETVGLPTAFVIVFMWWAYHKDKRQEKRYDELCDKINEVQNEQRKELLDISVKAITSQAASTVVQKELVSELRSRPCIAKVS